MRPVVGERFWVCRVCFSEIQFLSSDLSPCSLLIVFFLFLNVNILSLITGSLYLIMFRKQLSVFWSSMCNKNIWRFCVVYSDVQLKCNHVNYTEPWHLQQDCAFVNCYFTWRIWTTASFYLFILTNCKFQMKSWWRTGPGMKPCRLRSLDFSS